MLLKYLHLTNYRSIADKQEIGPFEKINVFIGKNNSGKSWIASAIKKFPEFAAKARSPQKGHFDRNDYFKGEGDRYIELSYQWWLNYEEYESVKATCGNPQEFEALESVYSSIGDIEKRKLLSIPCILEITKETLSNEDEGASLVLCEVYADITGHGLNKTVARQAINQFAAYILNYGVNSFFDLPDVRAIKPGDKYRTDGSGLIRELARLRSPSSSDDRSVNRRKFEIIQSFLRDLLNDNTAEMDPVPDSNELFIKSKYLDREISELGYGITELVLFATAISHLYRGIIVIEEPELHLHPELIKKLLYFISNGDFSNQVFITTHSNAVLDVNVPKNVFYVTHNGEKTTQSRIENYDGLFNALSNLGYTPSDILQSNCVIWVEGPSDRIYINAWLELYVKEHGTRLVGGGIKEGLQYCFAFYGGKCLSHFGLNADNGEIEEEQSPEELVNILELSRNCMLVMDSDNKEEEGEINKTKKRVRDELKSAERFCWVTDGREIENYLSLETVQKEFEGVASFGLFDKLGSSVKGSEDYDGHKVKYAKRLAGYMSYDSEFTNKDLKEKISLIVELIETYNGVR